jgi:hypothetical protein
VVSEAGYVDDLDLIATDPNALEWILAKMVTAFRAYNLAINDRKTERKVFEPTMQTPTEYKKLGSNIDMATDVFRRVQFTNGAFHSMWKMRSGPSLTKNLKLQLYNVTVKSLFMYNVASTYYTMSIGEIRVCISSTSKENTRNIISSDYQQRCPLPQRRGGPPSM